MHLQGMTLKRIITSPNTENGYNSLFIYYNYYNFHNNVLVRTQIVLAPGYRRVLILHTMDTDANVHSQYVSACDI